MKSFRKNFKKNYYVYKNKHYISFGVKIEEKILSYTNKTKENDNFNSTTQKMQKKNQYLYTHFKFKEINLLQERKTFKYEIYIFFLYLIIELQKKI